MNKSFCCSVGLIGLRGNLLILKRIKVNQEQQQVEEEVLHFTDIMLLCQGKCLSHNFSLALSCPLSLKALCFYVIVCCRERVPAQNGETAEEISDVERRAAAAVASTLESEEADNGGGYSARNLMKSSSISGSKCIGVQSKTDKEVS